MPNQQLIPFKVFGLQRTGTNLLVALMVRNFYAHSLETGAEWKHGPVREPERLWNTQAARFVLCVKNPYAWAVSCYRYIQKMNGIDPTVSLEFQRDPSVSFEEFLIRPSYGFPTPIHHWNQMYRLWLNTLPAQRTAVVRQEDQLNDQRRVLQRLQQQFGLFRRATDLQPFDQKVDMGSRTTGPMDRDYYLDRHYMLEYSPCLLERVNHLIDDSIMNHFHYEKEAWTLERRQINEMNLVVRPCTSDAAHALQHTFDPYHLKQLHEAGVEMRGCLDIGAGIGAASARVKSLWPQCRVLAYEACPERLRVLRINTQKLQDMTCVCAAVTAGRAAQIRVNDVCRDKLCTHASSSAMISTISFEKAASQLTNMDMLRIGSGQLLPEILPQLQSGGRASNFRWICGRVASDGSAAHVMAQLTQAYWIQSWPDTAGEIFLAERRSSRTY